MSKYTTQVRWIVENLPLSTAEFSAVEIPDEITGAAIGAFSNVMNKLNQDTVLNQIILETPFRNTEDWKRIGIKIIMHYYMKEIGYETVALWLMALNARLNLIMPYYNQLLDSADKMMPIDYFKDIDSKEEYDETGSDTHTMQKGSGTDTTGSSTGETNTTGTERETDTRTNATTGTENLTSSGNTDSTGSNTMNGTEHTLNSDTPQANYHNPPLDYATTLQDVTRNETNNSTAHQDVTGTQATTRESNQNENGTRERTHGNGETSTGTEERHTSETGTQSDQGTKQSQFIRKRTGMTGSRSYMELLQQYRDTILNIDEQIVLELDDLFMRIY